MWDEMSIFEVKKMVYATNARIAASYTKYLNKMKNYNILVFPVLILIGLLSCEKDKSNKAVDIYNEWEVIDYMSIESVLYAKSDNTNPVIEFQKDGSFALKLDANRCFGSFILSGENEIEISSPGCTKMCCDSDFSNKVTIMLPKVKSHTLEDGKLKLNVPEWGWINLRLITD